MSKLQAVIFDMDGVIIDSQPIFFEVEQQIFDKLDINISREKHNSFVGMTMEGLWEEVKDEHQLKETIEELIQLHKKGMFEYMSQADELPRIELITELIEKLSTTSLQLAVASSSPKKLIELVLTKLNLKNYFEIIISGEEVKQGKPAPDIFQAAVSRLEVNPKCCLVIEDSSNGAKAAKKAGMKCIGFKNANSGEQDLSIADTVVKSTAAKLDINLLKSLF